MAKKRVKRRSKFSRKFNIWDFIIIALIVGLGFWIFVRDGINGLTTTILNSIFFGLIVGFIIKFLLSRASK